MDKLKRCDLINQLLEIISKQDRGFFRTGDNLAKFEVRNNRVYFIDDYTKDPICAYHGLNRRHRGFSHGGTLWALVNDFREWIVTGKYSDGVNGYGGLYATCWGVSIKSKENIINKAKEIGYLPQDSSSYKDFCKRLLENDCGWQLGCNQDEVKKELGIA